MKRYDPVINELEDEEMTLKQAFADMEETEDGEYVKYVDSIPGKVETITIKDGDTLVINMNGKASEKQVEMFSKQLHDLFSQHGIKDVGAIFLDGGAEIKQILRREP